MFCYHCGQEVETFDNFCWNCGTNLNINPKQNNDEKTIYKVNFKNLTPHIYKRKNPISDYIVLDFETTGLSSFSERITEFTFLKYKNFELVDSFTSLVNPMKEIPFFVTQKTGITNEMVKDKEDISYHSKKILDFIDGYVLIGHNISTFDNAFLCQAIKYATEHEMQFEIIDTLTLSKKLIKDISSYKLENLKKYIKYENDSHRSTADCETTNELYKYLVELIQKNKKGDEIK